jgi:hypothetical protein
LCIATIKTERLDVEGDETHSILLVLMGSREVSKQPGL